MKDIENTRKIVGRYGITGKQQTTPIGCLSDGQRVRSSMFACVYISSVVLPSPGCHGKRATSSFLTNLQITWILKPSMPLPMLSRASMVAWSLFLTTSDWSTKLRMKSGSAEMATFINGLEILSATNTTSLPTWVMNRSIWRSLPIIAWEREKPLLPLQNQVNLSPIINLMLWSVAVAAPKPTTSIKIGFAPPAKTAAPAATNGKSNGGYVPPHQRKQQVKAEESEDWFGDE